MGGVKSGDELEGGLLTGLRTWTDGVHKGGKISGLNSWWDGRLAGGWMVSGDGSGHLRRSSRQLIDSSIAIPSTRNHRRIARICRKLHVIAPSV